tara:strand:+ start:2019 stop:2471 length:453 start_codon:yes stop_codon:yes gene_type:complete
MIHNQNLCFKNLLAPMIKDNAAFDTMTEIDTAGFDYCTVVLHSGETTDIALAAFTITESDTAGSGHAAFFTMGSTTQVDGTATSGVNAADEIQAIEFDLRKRKRYINITASGGDGASVGNSLGVMAILSRANDIDADNKTQRGLDQLSRV